MRRKVFALNVKVPKCHAYRFGTLALSTKCGDPSVSMGDINTPLSLETRDRSRRAISHAVYGMGQIDRRLASSRRAISHAVYGVGLVAMRVERAF